MRRQVVLLAQQLAIPLEVVSLRADNLFEMDELFVTNSLIGIWPVARYEGHVYGKRALTERLMAALKPVMEQS
jgi:branched-subunit amino acid aminotransferase/4-amino-4-deoxychorismate lyase